MTLLTERYTTVIDYKRKIYFYKLIKWCQTPFYHSILATTAGDEVNQPLHRQDAEVKGCPHREADEFHLGRLHGSMPVHRSQKQEHAKADEEDELDDLERLPFFLVFMVPFPTTAHPPSRSRMSPQVADARACGAAQLSPPGYIFVAEPCKYKRTPHAAFTRNNRGQPQRPLRATAMQAVVPTWRQSTSLNQAPKIRRSSASE